MIEQMIEKIGWDPGNGVQKAAWVNGKVNTVTVPSVVGVGQIEQTGLSLAGMDSQRRQEKPFEISVDGVNYLVGPNVVSYAKPSERLDYGRFVEGTELRVMLYVVISQLGLSGSRVAMAIGLPVELLRNKAEAEALEKGMA